MSRVEGGPEQTDKHMLEAADPAASVGIFDSGLGGLTVVREVLRILPGEHVIYLGDTARVPYGTRSPGTILKYARVCAAHLQRRGIKFLVLACNTVSAVAMDLLRLELDIPVLGVVRPGAQSGIAASRSGRLGVIATARTVASGAYAKAAAGIDSRVEIWAKSAPLLVPLVEEGWVEGDVPERVVSRYLTPFREHNIDTLILGCTHYPLIADLIEREMHRICGSHCEIVDSATATAEQLAKSLSARGLRRAEEGSGSLELIVTDVPDRFGEVSSRFLGRAIDTLQITQVDLS